MKKKAAFSRDQLMTSRTFGYSADLTGAVLDGDRLYTKDAAEKEILAYLEGKPAEMTERGN